MQKNRKQQLLEFLESEPNDTFLKYALALEYIKEENYEQAKTALNEVLTLDKTYLAAYYQLGKIYEKHQNNNKAVEIYAEGMKQAQTKGDKHAYEELRFAAAGLDDSFEDEI